jgi:predicted O-methyltransferase YrrM
MIKSPPEMRAAVNELSNATWALATIGVLFESGLADQLGEPRSADELATTCRAFSARRIEKILGLAAAHGVVVADGARYRLAEGVQAVLCGPMRATIAGELRSQLMQPLAFLDSATASAPTELWRDATPVMRQAQGDASSILPAMIKTAIAPMLGDLATRIARPGAKFLDVGTGVGALAIAACKAFPEIRVVGIDSHDEPIELARAAVARAGLAERIELRRTAVEQLRDEAAYACAWLPAFFIADDQLPAAIVRIAASLEPGGWLLMGTPGAGDAKQAAVWGLVADLWGGPTPTTMAAEGLLRDAGLREVRTMPGPPWAPQMIAGQR